jgi:GMP synthase (glutamine-hydrolysing)
MKWLLVQHEPFEGPALFAAALARQGVQLQQVRPYAGDRIPHPAELLGVDGLLVMGGTMNALDDLRHPHLRAERELLATATRSGLPVLGVCLGAQLLAAALGAEVTTMAQPEIGFGEVGVTECGRRDPAFAGVGDRLPVVHWHGDTFDLPDGAVLLAQSDVCRHQAFRWGERTYGLQFHPELTSEDLVNAGDHLPAELAEHERQLRVGAAERAEFVERLVQVLVEGPGALSAAG